MEVCGRIGQAIDASVDYVLEVFMQVLHDLLSDVTSSRRSSAIEQLLGIDQSKERRRRRGALHNNQYHHHHHHNHRHQNHHRYYRHRHHHQHHQLHHGLPDLIKDLPINNLKRADPNITSINNNSANNISCTSSPRDYSNSSRTSNNNSYRHRLNTMQEEHSRDHDSNKNLHSELLQDNPRSTSSSSSSSVRVPTRPLNNENDQDLSLNENNANSITDDNNMTGNQLQHQHPLGLHRRETGPILNSIANRTTSRKSNSNNADDDDDDNVDVVFDEIERTLNISVKKPSSSVDETRAPIYYNDGTVAPQANSKDRLTESRRLEKDIVKLLRRVGDNLDSRIQRKVKKNICLDFMTTAFPDYIDITSAQMRTVENAKAFCLRLIHEYNRL